MRSAENPSPPDRRPRGSRGHGRPLAGIGFLLLALGVAGAEPAAARAPIGVGDSFPPLAAAELSGRAPPATEGRVVLVDFWASWCAPCKASFPVYGRLDSEFSQRGLVIVAVSVDEDASAFEAFVRRFEPAFLVELDRGQKLVREVQVPSMPTSYLIDRKGRVRFMHPGFHGRPTELALRAEIETLLSEKAP